jgi:CBS domain-containing protein
MEMVHPQLLLLLGIGVFGGTIGAWLFQRLRIPQVVAYIGIGLIIGQSGLQLMASHHLGHLQLTQGLSLGDAIIFVVTATTLVVQIVGPPMVKLTLKFADEIGRDVREEDVAEEILVGDVMNENPVTVKENEPLQIVLRRLAGNGQRIYPVLDADGKMTGIVSFESMREVLTSQDTWQWLVAADIAEQPPTTIAVSDSLNSAMKAMEQVMEDQVPVMQEEDSQQLAGMLDIGDAQQFLNKEVLRRRGNTDEA